MSVQEERQKIIRQYIPKLVSSITNFKETEPNFQLCEQFAWYTIRNHKNLSVNSHEIRRRIDGMREKFIIGNFQTQADHLKTLFDYLINHPLCLNHYETDVQWAIIDFLLNLSYNPVGSLRKNKDNLQLTYLSTTDNTKDSDLDYWVNLLKEDCIPIEHEDHIDDTSDLSDWSDTTLDEEILKPSKEDKKKQALAEYKPLDTVIPFHKLSSPKKEPHYKNFNYAMSKSWLYDNVQHSWWTHQNYNSSTSSVHESANFCQLWNQALAKNSTAKKLSITSEYCLLREVVWMFQMPSNCKFFQIKDGKISVNNDVSIASVTANGLKTFLQTFVSSMEKMYKLRQFIHSVYESPESGTIPCTYECYANGLAILLQQFTNSLIEFEKNVKAQKSGKIYSILQLKFDLSNHNEYLEKLYNIHVSSALDYTKYPAHICSAHLLAGLMDNYRSASCTEVANLSISLLLSSLKSFCEIIHTWWTEGRLDDWRSEFLVEKIYNESEEIVPRLYEKIKEKSFFVPTYISNIIQDDILLKLFMEHSLQAGCTLNLLYEINKINELRYKSHFEDTLYNNFIKSFTKEIWNYNFCLQTTTPTKTKESPNMPKFNENSLTDDEFNEFTLQFAPGQDELLLMAFESNLNITNNTIDEIISEEKYCPLRMYEQLNSLSKLILPLEDVIVKTFSSILQSQISFANNFVMDLYKEEFEVLKHLQNMRKVMLLEASDVMQCFYIKLFIQIESGRVWANPFLLSAQLDDILCAKFPHISSLYRVDIASAFKCDSTKVVDVIDQIIIRYDVKKHFQNIISEKSISDYNEVFRFLLKVKWGLWALENLHFQAKRITKPVYAEMKIIDLLMRRLEQLRFWMIYSMQSIHFHLMTHVLQSMDVQLDEKIRNCTTLSEMKSVHDSYIDTILEHCFLKSKSYDIKFGVEQLLHLIYVLRYEWSSCLKEIEEEDVSDVSCEDQISNYVLSSQIETIENTYIRCHGYLAKILNNEVYYKQNSYLTGLSAAFNSSVPY